MTTFEDIKDVIVEEVRKNKGDLIYVKVQDHSMNITIHAGLLETTWSISKRTVRSVSSCSEEFSLEDLSNDLVRMKNYSWVLSVMQRMLLK